jgi:hypothetical protein
MGSKVVVIILALALLGSCYTKRKMSRKVDLMASEESDLKLFCDTTNSFKTLYYNKIKARLKLGEDQYSAKLSLYYRPDSIIFVSAVNAGFEIMRIGVFVDSIVYINRFDKMVYVLKTSEERSATPVTFEDMEYLMNNQSIREEENFQVIGDTAIVVNRSLKNVVKEIEYSAEDVTLKRFEFFQKKTGEYVVGQISGKNNIVIYSNFIVGHFIFEGSEGEVEYNREIKVDLSINRKKYDIVYL